MGKYQSLKFKITGVAPLLLHNGAMADPMNQFSKRLKEISGKRAKTDADYTEMARIEFYGGLYTDSGKIVIPGEVLESSFVDAARSIRKGKQAMGGIICPDNYPLVYDGPQSIDDRWADESCRLTCGVRIQKNRVMRTRPVFRKWSLEFELMYDTGKLDEREIMKIINTAGDNGLCDWRPRFGRYSVEST